MERDEFIKQAIQALNDVVGSLDDFKAGNTPHTSDGEGIRYEKVYEKLMYDYPDVSEMELKALVMHVSSYKGNSPKDRNESASLMLMEEIFGTECIHDDGDGMLRRKALTVVENMQRGAQSLSGVWQELYGHHVFSLLLKDRQDIVSYEDFFGKDGCQVREVVLDEETAWSSGRLGTALHRCISQATSSSLAMTTMEAQMDVLFEFLKYSLVQSIHRGHTSVVNAVYDAVLGCCCKDGAQGSVQSMVRSRVSYMTASLLIECRMDVGLKHGYVERVLMDVLPPEVNCTRKGEPVLIVAAAACVEYLVRYGIRNTSMKSWKTRFERDLIRSGMYNACIQEFIRLTKEEGPCHGELYILARALVLVACFSEELRSWSVRVPGYSDAWNRYTHAPPVLKTTWRVVSSMPGDEGHIHVLQGIFDTNSTLIPTARSDMESLEEEEQRMQLLIEHLSTLVVITTALRGAAYNPHNAPREETMSRIKQERDAIHDRIATLSPADDSLPMIHEEEDHNKKHHGASPSQRQRPLLLIQSYRECDGLLKHLSFSLRDSTHNCSKHE